MLWQRHRGHPNLLESHFDDSTTVLASGWVRKPLFSREGANIELRDFAGVPLHADGPYGGAGMIRQRLCPLPVFVDQQRNREVHTLIGSWVVGGQAAGIGIREDDTPITRNSSRFVPHIMLD